LPEAREALDRIVDRQPFQTSQLARLGAVDDCVAITPLERFDDGAGLGAWVVDVPAGASVRLPRVPGARGAYAALVKGSMRVGSRTLHAPTVAYVDAADEPLRVSAGDAAAQWLVLSFPGDAPNANARVRAAAPHADDAGGAAPWARWDCRLCGFSYDERIGQPELGIAAGTRWSELPETWHCGDCDAARSEFVSVSEELSAPAARPR